MNQKKLEMARKALDSWLSYRTPDGDPAEKLIELSCRAENIVSHAMWQFRNKLEYYKVRDLVIYSERTLSSIRGCGEKTIKELKTKLKPFGLHLGMTKDEIKKIDEDSAPMNWERFESAENALAGYWDAHSYEDAVFNVAYHGTNIFDKQVVKILRWFYSTDPTPVKGL